MVVARPGPAPKRGETGLVDLHDQDALVDRRGDQLRCAIKQAIVEMRHPIIRSAEPGDGRRDQHDHDPFAVKAAAQHRQSGAATVSFSKGSQFSTTSPSVSCRTPTRQR